MGMWQFLRREPMVFFVLIGCGLFAADRYMSEQRKPQIVIDDVMRNAIWAQDEALKGAPLTTSEQSAAVQTYIDNQILFDDALRLGLDKDRNVHAMVIRKYKALMGAAIAEPTSAELKHYYLSHQQDYMNPRLYDIEEYFFPIASDSVVEATSAAVSIAEREAWLRDKGAPTRLGRLSERDLLMRMGKEISQQLVLAEPKQWSEPLKNYRGVYFVRIVAIYDAVPKTYEEVERYLRDAWVKQEQNNIIQAKLAHLKPGYQIHVSQE